MLLSVVVPVYNEEANIKKFYSSVKKVLNTLPYDQEIIFVDDGSSDDSATMLSHIAAEDKDVKVCCWPVISAINWR